MTAIELATKLESYTFGAAAAMDLRKEIATELRRLVAENTRLQGQCAKCAQLKAEAMTMVHDYDENA
ncbi:hypothetical protein NT239_00915 [Chitinibacter sp. SCUT-21]|uniref:hypothetical protein n=1 Tax=Chitinibacter sp. SCUT-21 TaxID=2970891 RepID=UPI0035A677C7